MTRTDVLVFVEDPGAANCVAALGAALAQVGIASTLLASGSACAHLASLAVPHVACSPASTASGEIEAHNPRLVLCGTAENRHSLGLALIAEARSRSLPSVGVVDGPSHAADRFSGSTGRPDAYAPDRILVPDTATAASFRALGFAPSRIVVAGHPQFDRLRAERARLDAEGRTAVRRRVLPDAGDGRPLVVFLSELSDGMAPALYRRAPHWTLSGRGGSDLRTQVALEEFLDASAGRGWIRILRLHPKSRAEEYAAYARELEAISSGGLPYDIVYAADLVVGMTTFLLVEAALLGRPTLAILPDAAHAAWLPSIAAGITPVAHRRAEIAAALDEGLENPPDRMAVDRAFPAGATRRVAELVASML